MYFRSLLAYPQRKSGISMAARNTPTQASFGRAKFGAFEADFGAYELRKHGIRLKIQDQPFQILRRLLDRPGQLVTREELRAELWAESTFVDFDAGLNAAVRRLREVLNDSAERPRYVETLPRHGYRFIAPVEAIRAPSNTSHAEQVATPELFSDNGNDHQSDAALAQSGRPISWRRAFAFAAMLALVAGISGTMWWSRRASANAPSRIRTIAVLPLQNLTGDPQREFFVEGMTETLITEMAQIHSLRVSSGGSPELKQANLSISKIAKRLDVDAVLKGALLQSAPKVRINLQLIEAGTERCRWAKEYERDPREVINLQQEIAKAVAAEIPVQLEPAEKGRLGRDRPVNADAYEKYVQGQYLWRKRTVKSLRASVDYFQEAVDLDPGWAQGYAGLAEAYVMLGYGVMVDLPPDQAAHKARAYALRAAELDPTLAAPHAVLGLIKHRHDWDWSGAEVEFKRAIELDPSYVTAHYWYSTYFMTLLRNEEEKIELAAARRLDPTYSLIFNAVADNLYRSGQREQAISLWKDAVKVDDENWPPHYNLVGVFEQSRQYDEAVREVQRVMEISDGNLRIKGVLARLYAEMGRTAEARAIIEEIKGKTNADFSIAEVYLALGEKEQALKHLAEAIRERCGWVVFVKVLPWLEPLRTDPRFQEMIRQINFPQT